MVLHSLVAAGMELREPLPHYEGEAETAQVLKLQVEKLEGDRKYLDQMVEKYPHGDRIEEAKFLLQQIYSKSGDRNPDRQLTNP